MMPLFPALAAGFAMIAIATGAASAQTQSGPPPLENVPRPPAINKAPTPPPAPLISPMPEDASNKARLLDVQGFANLVITNYPSAALRAAAEGAVTVQVRVTPEGRATQCEVVRSSGHESLDEGACRAVKRYARFEPARDASGQPVAGRWSNTIRYSLD